MSWDPGETSKQILAATKEVDAAKRIKIYEDFQRFEAANAPAIHLFQEINIAATKANVTGVTMGLLYDATRYDSIAK